MAKYAFPDLLVSTEWVAEHQHDPQVRIVESDEDPLVYQQGHIPGAVRLDWHTDLENPVIRDFVDKDRFEQLMRSKGIANDTTVVLYGDKNNWWACYAFWVFKLYGHEKCVIMDGGRKRWELDGKPLVRDPEPSYPAIEYHAKEPDLSIRAFRDEVLKHARAGKPLVDVRSPGEFTGQLLHMPDYPQEGALRGGHIPGAVNIPWGKAANEDGTFKSPKDLEKLYLKEGGLKRGARVVAYCRIGERSSHTWFVLKYLLGFKNVKNYDGSWTEWGNAVAMPVERGEGAAAAEPSAPPAPATQSVPEAIKSEPATHVAESPKDGSEQHEHEHVAHAAG
jgi:thiosulfate/3-mercaptopyruvate sulfurtransferase